MRFKSLAILASLSMTATLAGCASTDMGAMFGNGSATTNAHYSATDPHQVKIYYGNQRLPRHYQVIGQVSAEHHNMVGIPISSSSINEELKKQAASIGGRGIINITYGLDSTNGDVIR